jgi:hypothetical protein
MAADPRRVGARHWLGGGLASLLGLAGLVLLLEGGTRLLGVRAPALEPPTSTLWVYDATKGWANLPNARGSAYVGEPGAARVRINALGLRGREIGRKPRDGVERIQVFGDSFAFGLGVDEEQLFTSHLERLLASAGSRRFEVVNMAVSGYSTDQQYLLLREKGARLAPDLVVLLMCDNDFLANTEDFAYKRYYKPYFVRTPAGRPSLRNSPVPLFTRAQKLKIWLAERSNLWNLVRDRRSENALAARFLDSLRVGVPRRSGEDPVEITLALVAAFKEIADGLGAAFLTANTGHRGESTELYHALRPRLESAGIPFVGLEAALGEARRREPDRHWDFESDTHWNVDSHALAARVVFSHLQRSYLSLEGRP